MTIDDLFRRENIPPLLAFFYTTVYFTLLMVFVLGFVKIAPENRDMVTVLMGVLTAAQSSIISYYFGSSYGSERKNELLAGKQAG